MANIFSVINIYNIGYHITYDRRNGYYALHTNNGEVKFQNDEIGIPYIDAEKTQYMAFVWNTCDNF